jgi:pimeloyl-ACP methyl ester carboxylesterase
MSSKSKKILIIVLILACAACAGGFFALDKATNGILSYYIWKTTSSNSGKGDYSEINGIAMYYEVHGKGEPLLLLHGGTVFIESFCRQIPALAREFMVIAPDSRGHGRSGDTDAPLCYRAMADDMVQLLEKLNIPRAHIVGWSDGGIIGIDLALRRPEMVDKLVLIGANFDVSGLTAESIEQMKKMTPYSSELAEVRDFYNRIAPDPTHWPVLINKIKGMWLSQPHYSRKELQKIKSPTLIIAGENDVIRTSHTLEMAGLIKRSRHLIVPGASHLVPIERHEIVNREIIGFLKEPGSSAHR